MDFSTCDSFPRLIPKIAVVTPQELREKYGNEIGEIQFTAENRDEKEIETKVAEEC